MPSLCTATEKVAIFFFFFFLFLRHDVMFVGLCRNPVRPAYRDCTTTETASEIDTEGGVLQNDPSDWTNK